MTPVTGGVAVTEVVAGTPAERAGLEAATGTKLVDGQEEPTGGDVVVEFDGDAVTSAVALQSAVDTHQPGDTVSITVVRNSSRRTLDVTLGVRP
jgi:putative serine protease PepD